MTTRPNFLPNFCGIRAVFLTVISAQLLAFILTLGPTTLTGSSWLDLSLVSLFVQWVALTSAAACCLLRRQIGRLADGWAATAAMALLLTVTLILALLALEVLEMAGFQAQLDPRWGAQLIWRSLAVSAIVGAIVLRYLYVQHHWARQVEAEAEARVQALKARIRPHFLFNSMNSIASLTQSDPEQAERVVMDLSDLFRATLSEERDLVTLEQEVALTRQYLNIETLRLGERLKVRYELDSLPPKAQLPALTLQPLVENAVYHGIETHPQGGTVTLKGYWQEDSAIIEISNPAPPIDVQRQRPGNRIALETIRQRLMLHFGDAAQLTITENELYSVQLRVPLENGDD